MTKKEHNSKKVKSINLKYDTASMSGYNCLCGWPIIFVCCNGDFTNYKDANEHDWWIYCSNKICENHEGEGLGFSYPDWASSINKKRL